MAVELAPRLLARADRVARAARLGGAAKPVLHRGVGLALELEEIADRKVLGLQPVEKRRIILGRAGEMDMGVARDPALRGVSLQGPECQRNFSVFTGPNLELLRSRRPKQPSIRFEAIATCRQLVATFAVEKNEVRLSVVGHLQRPRRSAVGNRLFEGTPPETFAVMQVDPKGEEDVHRAEAKGFAVLEEVDPGGRRPAGIGSKHGEMQPRRGSRGLTWTTRLPVTCGRYHHCGGGYRSQARDRSGHGDLRVSEAGRAPARRRVANFPYGR